MEPAQLQLLALIERHGSMAGAAQALGRTPAAITQQLAKAERELKTTLVHRGPRGAALTAAGALLARHGRIIDEETQRAALGLDGLLGRLSLRLRIGAFQAAALHLLPPALTALRHRYPAADLTVTDVSSDQGVDEVVAGRLDMAVIASWDTPITPPDLVTVHPLLRDPMVVVLPDDHPALTATALAESALAESALAETALAETVLAETALAETALAETALAETVLAERTLAERTLAETVLAETVLAETALAETVLAERTLAERVLAEVALGGSARAESAPVGLEQFRDEAWVTILAGHAARAQFDRVTAAAGFTPRIRFQTASYDVAQALVGTGIGVALVSRLALAYAPRTAHRALRPPVPHRDLQVVTMTDATVTPMVEVFLRLLRDVANDLESGWAAEDG